MALVPCLIYFALTVVIPLKLTFSAIKNNEGTKLWAIYWAIYTFISTLFYYVPFLGE